MVEIDDDLWLTGKSKRIYRVRGDGSTAFYQTEATLIFDLAGLEDPSGRFMLYLGTDRGLSRIDRSQLSDDLRSLADAEQVPGGQFPVLTLASFAGSLWLGGHRGAGEYRDGTIRPIRQKIDDSLATPDHLWMIGPDGAVRIDGDRVMTRIRFLDEEGKETEPPPLRAVFEVDGEIWLTDSTSFGGNPGPLWKVEGDTASVIPELSDIYTLSVAEIEGQLLLSHLRGLTVLEQGAPSQSISFDLPVNLSWSYADKFWLATGKEILLFDSLSRLDELRWKWEVGKVEQVRVFADSLWIAAEEGVYRVVGDLSMTGRLDPGPLPVVAENSVKIGNVGYSRAGFEDQDTDWTWCVSSDRAVFELDSGHDLNCLATELAYSQNLDLFGNDLYFVIEDGKNNRSPVLHGQVNYLPLWQIAASVLLLGLIFAGIRLRTMGIDKLSGLRRRGFGGSVAIKRVYERRRKTGRGRCLVFIDLDDFSDINNQHGYDAGDAAVAAVGAVIKSHCRKEDFPIRWGGDEFLAVLSIDHREAAENALERLSSQIRDQHVAGEVRLSASIGAKFSDQQDEDFAAALQAAEKALKAVKSQCKGEFKLV